MFICVPYYLYISYVERWGTGLRMMEPIYKGNTYYMTCLECIFTWTTTSINKKTKHFSFQSSIKIIMIYIIQICIATLL